MPVWQEAGRLYQRVLDVIEEPNVPLSPTFRNQLERASLCISNCVAEAYEGCRLPKRGIVDQRARRVDRGAIDGVHHY